MNTTNQKQTVAMKIKRHGHGAPGAAECAASGRVIENLPVNGTMVECPVCRRIVNCNAVTVCADTGVSK